MSAKQWVRLDPAKLGKESGEGIQGVEIQVFLSPYDIPMAVRGDYDEQEKRFVIRFRYIVGEPSKSLKIDNKYIRLSVGKNSGRLQTIEVDVDALSATHVGLRMLVPRAVKDAIERLASEPERGPQRANYRIAGDVIADRQEEIFEDLVTA